MKRRTPRRCGNPPGQQQPGLVQNVEADADQEEQQELQIDHEAAEHQGGLCLSERATGQVTLDHELIGPVGCHREERPADQTGPERVRLCRIGREVEQRELVG
jgi:hypothetical protein